MKKVDARKLPRFWKPSSVLGLLLLLCAGAVAQTMTYKVVDLGTLGGTFSNTGGVNNGGQVAGGATISDDAALHAFLWNEGVMKDLNTLGGPHSFASAVSNTGAVVGNSDISASPGNPDICFDEFFNTFLQCRGFIWQHGVMTDLGTLGGDNSTVAGDGVNSRAQVVGGAELTTPDPFNPPFNTFHAFLWNRGVMADLGTLGGYRSEAFGINDLGQVVGGADPFSEPQSSCGGCVPAHAFLWQSGVMSDLGTLPGANFSFGLVINNQGQIVGRSTLAGDVHVHAVLWQGTVMSDLDTLPGDTDSDATDISPRGQAVGLSCGAISCAAVLWQNGTITDLNTLIPADSDLYLVTAFQINARGQITGTAIQKSTGETHAYLATPTLGGEVHASPKFAVPESVRKLLQRRMHHMYGFK